MDSVIPRPGKVEIGFTDDRLTGTGGAVFLAEAAKRLGLLPLLAEAVSVKRRARGASDAETQWSLVASLASGGGALSDVDALRGDAVQRELLGLREAPSSRRLGEFLRRLTKWDVERLEGVLRHLTAALAPAVVEHEVSERGYVPVFVDGTGIEVDGRLFEHAARLYTGERGYWLHGIFVGGLWVSGRLRPGGDVTCGWKGQMKRDLAPLPPPGTPVWVHCDSAHYRGAFVEYVSDRGWDYSVSVTDANKCRPVLDVVEDLPEHGWTDIGMGESATWVRHRPARWRDEQSYVVVRGTVERQGELFPRLSVILASRDDLPLAEVVRRHRSKQGHENAFKGPLVDLDLHHPPCRGYRANQAFHAYGRMAHLLLRAVQYGLLPKAARRHGIRPLVRHLMRTVARLVASGRRRSLLFASCCFRRDWLFFASLQLEGG
ncbi:MAG: transposase [Gammaproteobacteria bacterium]|nr:transposase [Gammaproteobacteria bacterium]MDE0271516.1 transposase [Gammaproteobacteria bacterium]